MGVKKVKILQCHFLHKNFHPLLIFKGKGSKSKERDLKVRISASLGIFFLLVTLKNLDLEIKLCDISHFLHSELNILLL